jgi:dTDP-4-amino-4,6-dideoxygalactose transaminase
MCFNAGYYLGVAGVIVRINNLVAMKPLPFYSLAAQHTQLRDALADTFSRITEKNQFITGDELRAFEKELAAYHQARYSIGVGNGFDAIYLSLKALGIGEGDEVIVPVHTYIATWLAVSQTGATPVPVDTNASTWLIDTNQIERKISSRTKAIIPVNLYGFPCHLQAIEAMAQQHQLKIVEDNAQAIGASQYGRKTGTFGHCNAFSFYPTKNLGALGDGGAIVTNDERIYQHLRALRNYGQQEKHNTIIKGVNSRLDELQAAWLRVKLPLLDRWNEQRKELAHLYQHELAGIKEITLPQPVPGAEPVYHLFAVAAQRRDSLQHFLAEHEIETQIHYPSLPYQQPAYAELKIPADAFPVAEQLVKELLSLPLWHGMPKEDVLRVSKTIRSFYNR